MQLLGPDRHRPEHTGIEWWPKLNNHIILVSGLSTIIPGGAFLQLYNSKDGRVPALFNGFAEPLLAF